MKLTPPSRIRVNVIQRAKVVIRETPAINCPDDGSLSKEVPPRVVSRLPDLEALQNPTSTTGVGIR